MTLTATPTVNLVKVAAGSYHQADAPNLTITRDHGVWLVTDTTASIGHIAMSDTLTGAIQGLTVHLETLAGLRAPIDPFAGFPRRTDLDDWDI